MVAGFKKYINLCTCWFLLKIQQEPEQPSFILQYHVPLIIGAIIAVFFIVFGLAVSAALIQVTIIVICVVI